MSKNSLKISADLSLPVDLVTQTIGVLAKRRAGKSYLLRRIAEQVFRAGQQIVIADPKGDWWGIRSAADGKAPGLPIIILGGERGDVPLEANAGEVVAKLVVEERVSALLDLSLLRKHEVATFMTGFLENLYRLKAREQYRTPMLLAIDEADAIAPQRPMKGEERMLGACEDIVRRGGQRGIGCAMATQRAAVLNKNVLTQVQVLVALRTIAPQDLAALDAWIDVHGTTEQRRELMESLPSLPVGDAWVWSPGWPTVDGIFDRVHVLPIETFDSGSTPKPGEKRVEPRSMADVDLAALRAQMSGTIERAKADDPKELRKRIADLTKRIGELERGPSSSTPAEPSPRDVTRIKREVAAEYESLLKERDSALRDAQRKLVVISKAIDRAHTAHEEIARELGKELPKLTAVAPMSAPPVRREVHLMRRDASTPRSASDGNGVPLPEGERAVLIAIAQNPDGATREQITILTGYKRSTRDAYIQRLRGRDYVEASGDVIVASGPGIDALGSSFEPLPTGAALREYWRERLPEGERRVFEVVIAAYPNAVNRDLISDRTGYKRSTRDAYAQRLSTRRLVTSVGRGELRATDTLFA